MDQHAELLQEVYEQLRPIFEGSEQSIYIYLDDNHKVCNKRFATLLGYRSPEEWAAVQESFPLAFVDEGSQLTLVDTYQDAMERMIGTLIEVAWKKKAGGTVETTVILVPYVHKGHLMALHFIAE